MQLTELLYQRVKDLGAQGQIALRPGYVAVVSRAPSLRGALLAALYAGPDDVRRLTDGEGPTRIGLGLVSGDGTPYRLLRELGGARQLQRLDAASKKFSTLSEDHLDRHGSMERYAGLKAKLVESLQAVTKLKGEVEIVAPGSLPNDGKVIADERPVS